MTQPWASTNLSVIVQAKSKFFLYCNLLSAIQLQVCQKLCGSCTRQLDIAENWRGREGLLHQYSMLCSILSAGPTCTWKIGNKLVQ